MSIILKKHILHSSPLLQISEASENVDWDNVDLVDILIRPWLRIDGTLNRRVLDRLLGAILGCAMHRPGISIEKISEKLSPALMVRFVNFVYLRINVLIIA